MVVSKHPGILQSSTKYLRQTPPPSPISKLLCAATFFNSKIMQWILNGNGMLAVLLSRFVNGEWISKVSIYTVRSTLDFFEHSNDRTVNGLMTILVNKQTNKQTNKQASKQTKKPFYKHQLLYMLFFHCCENAFFPFLRRQLFCF